MTRHCNQTAASPGKILLRQAHAQSVTQTVCAAVAPISFPSAFGTGPSPTQYRTPQQVHDEYLEQQSAA